ncbi:putative sulfate exporter family transporter [Tissierella pigra]|uniref:Putative sulfate exporter family transporter n=1 Tax=Tissierella pigra TaxID=2607614 RepID=A0A6N7XWU8_9FIRM|nr:putative sulfate exporter family transporter [Tissierella pigra]MBU5427531.1 putative sulfate exporter family transporter [Tissierella pigra]MSU00280.1 putative sulfate exporter family transporter [Tissierella pigra]
MNSKKTSAIILCILIAIVATYLGGLQNLVGAPMIGLFIGMLILNIIPSIDKDFKSGTTFAGKKFLTWGIILAGATLNFKEVLGYGAKALPLLLFNICLSFSVAYFVGKKLDVSTNTCTLVGGGSCICGGTAIATLASIIKAKETEIAYAMTAIFLFDILAALVYPYLAGAIGLTANQFGFLAGAAINDTSSVAAAEATYNVLNNLDSSLAITIKLARTSLLILVSIVATILTVRNESKANKDSGEQISIGQTVMKVFPWFIVIFLGMAVLNTLGLFDLVPGSAKFFKKGYKFLITAALAGVGFKIHFKDLFTKGTKPIILGGCTWAAVAISTLLFITIFANYIG